MKLDKQTKKEIINLWEEKRISLEGNILKLIEADGDVEFQKYLDEALERDKESRRKRLTITKQVQIQNNELVKWKEENEETQRQLKESLERTEQSMQEATILKEEAEVAKIEAENAMMQAELSREEAERAREEAEKARQEAENAKVAAETNLDFIQKKTQFELIGTIVKVALYVILGVGVVVTGMYLFAILNGTDTQVIGSTWSNIIGILLTNAFSIVGTIMGVKYASEKSNGE